MLPYTYLTENITKEQMPIMHKISILCLRILLKARLKLLTCYQNTSAQGTLLYFALRHTEHS